MVGTTEYIEERVAATEPTDKKELGQSDPETAARLLERAQEAVRIRRRIYLQMAEQA